MSDTPRQFKVGDWVTPCKEAVKMLPKHSAVIMHIGKTYKIWAISPDGSLTIKLENGTRDGGWNQHFWRLCKNTIVKDIINDL